MITFESILTFLNEASFLEAAWGVKLARFWTAYLKLENRLLSGIVIPSTFSVSLPKSVIHYVNLPVDTSPLMTSLQTACQ